MKISHIFEITYSLIVRSEQEQKYRSIFQHFQEMLLMWLEILFIWLDLASHFELVIF